MGVLRNAVAEIEHVPRARAERAENVCDFTTYALRLTEEHGRIQITLQCNAITDAPARFADIYGPVEADPIRADRGNVLQPHAAAFREDDAWNGLAIAGSRELRDDALQVCE